MRPPQLSGKQEREIRGLILRPETGDIKTVTGRLFIGMVRGEVSGVGRMARSREFYKKFYFLLLSPYFVIKYN